MFLSRKDTSTRKADGSSALSSSKRGAITITYQFEPMTLTIDGKSTLNDLKELILKKELQRARLLPHLTLDDVELKKGGETLGAPEKKRSSKRSTAPKKSSRSLKRLGLAEGDALTLHYSPTTADALAAAGGEEEKLRSALLSVSIRRSHTDGDAASSLTHDISTWEIPIKDITLHPQRLGSGSYGTVVKGELRGSEVAVKCITLPEGPDAQEQSAKIIANFRNECAIMTKLPHPNVLTLMGVCIEEQERKLMIVMELMKEAVFDMLHPKYHQQQQQQQQQQQPQQLLSSAGSTVVGRGGGGGAAAPPFKKRMRIARDCCLGMNYLHCATPAILHLDLKTQNLLLSDQDVAKVADFGLSCVSSPLRTAASGPVGTPIYTAPELVLDPEEPPTTKADVYSFGIILWELLTCEVPYPDINDIHEVVAEIVNGGKRPPIPESCPTKLADLMRQCWDQDPQVRPSFASILQSHVLDEVIIDEVISKHNELARVFWKTKIAKVDKVGRMRNIEKSLTLPWGSFLKKLASFCNLCDDVKTIKNKVKIRALRLLLANKSGEVTIERFAEILEWFGPFTANGKTLLANIKKTTGIPGFFGDDFKDQKALANLMAGREVGSYIIRFSSQVGSYTITSMAVKDAMLNQRIDRTPDGNFMVKVSGTNHFFSSLEEIIEKFKQTWHLKKPLMPSRYSQLYEEEPDQFIYRECLVVSDPASADATPGTNTTSGDLVPVASYTIPAAAQQNATKN